MLLLSLITISLSSAFFTSIWTVSIINEILKLTYHQFVCLLITFCIIISILIIHCIVYIKYKDMCKYKLDARWKHISYKELKEMFLDNLAYDVLCAHVDDNYIEIQNYSRNKHYRYEYDLIHEYGYGYKKGVTYILSYHDFFKYYLVGFNSFARRLEKAQKNKKQVK